MTIASSPGGKTYPRGNNSLKVVTGTGKTFVQTAGFTPTVPATGSVDVSLSLYVASTSITSGNNDGLFQLGTDTAGATFQCLIQLANVSGTFGVWGQGSSQTSVTAISLSADHTIALHCANGTNASTLSVDGGAAKTFTSHGIAWNVITIGDALGTSINSTYYIGNIKIDAPVNGLGAGPSSMFSPSFFGSAATNITSTATFNSATIGSNCTYSTNESTSHPQSFTSGSHIPLLSPVTVLGVQRGVSEATPFGDSYDMSIVGNWYYQCAYVTFSPVTMLTYKMNVPLTGSDANTNFSGNNAFNVNGTYYSTNFVGNAGGSPNQNLCLETPAADNPCTSGEDVGSRYTYTPNATYTIQVAYPEYFTCAAGMKCIVPGAITSGTFTSGETVTSVGGASAVLIGTVTGAEPSKFMYLTLTSGTATSTDVWTGATGGAVYTATAVPQNYVSMWVYDASCNLVSTQLTVNRSTSVNIPVQFRIGRTGDTGAPSKLILTDYFIVDYARAQQIQCR